MNTNYVLVEVWFVDLGHLWCHMNVILETRGGTVASTGDSLEAKEDLASREGPGDKVTSSVGQCWPAGLSLFLPIRVD